jgi:AAA15 family ATPase/GTPase
MLIRFSVENFLSFKDEVELSMLPGKGRKHPEHIISSGKRATDNILKAAVIYGANASGKSNLIKAMSFARDIIVTGRRPKQTIPIKPFRFDTACEQKPSKFQFEFSYNSKSYIYGFTLDALRIHEEWLYRFTSTGEKPIFERKTDENNETHIEFSNIKFKNKKEREFFDFTAMGTRPNQLFLTEAIERDIKRFEDIYHWFNKILVFISPNAQREGLEFDFMSDQDFQKSFQNFLQIFDTGISGIKLIEFDLEKEAGIPDEVLSTLKQQMLQVEGHDVRVILHLPDGLTYLILRTNSNEFQAMRFMTIHKVNGENRETFLEVVEESDGTQRLFHLVPVLMELLGGERVVVIDELDRSLHPHLSYKVLELFLNNGREKKSQLIVTTHESSLLNLDLLRRDEIWFVEKNKDGVSNVYSLEEFAPRYDNDIQKGYLLGRFGAIPFIKSVESLGWLN